MRWTSKLSKVLNFNEIFDMSVKLITPSINATFNIIQGLLKPGHEEVAPMATEVILLRLCKN